MREADSKMRRGCLGKPKYDEALELYQQAANLFKMQKEWDRAAEAFDQCALCAQQSGLEGNASFYYSEAGAVLKKVSTQRAVEEYEKAISLFGNSGKFRQAGRLLMQIAELYEAESVQRSHVKSYYKRAVEMFELDERSNSDLTKCNLRVAEIAANLGELQEAIAILEDEGEKALRNDALHFHARERFLVAGFLHLAGCDSVSVNLAHQRYMNLDLQFASCKEGELFGNLAEAFENCDLEMFTAKLSEYESRKRLGAWEKSLLALAQEHMRKGGDPLGFGAIDLT